MRLLSGMGVFFGALLTGGAALAQPAATSFPAGKAMPVAGAEFSRKGLAPDEDVFVEKCAMCHRRNGMGTNILARRMPSGQAMLEARADLTGDYIRMAVRSGIGIMPRLGRGEVSDAQLSMIIKHLTHTTPARKGGK